MSMIITSRGRTQRPQGIVGVDRAVANRLGLTALYLLADRSAWRINQVTGAVGGVVAGTGVSWVDGLMRTPGTIFNGVTLETGISGASVPRSVLYGMRGISGVVSWSWMDETAFDWNGWYGTTSGDINASSANSFDGALVLSGGTLVNGVYRYVASHESATSLQGRVFGGSSAVDTSALVPTISSRITLGWANRSVDDNPAVADFEFFAVFNRSLSSSDQSALLANPWQLFAPVRRPVFFSSSGSASATLTSQGQAATSLKAGRNISVTFSSAGQAATTLLKGAIVGKTFSSAGQAATSLLGSYSVAGGNLLTINGQAATSFKAGSIVGKTLTSQGQAATSFLKGAVVSATLTSQGQASTTILGGLGSASATFAILGRASTNFLVPSATRGGGVAKKKNLRKKVKKRIEEDLFFIESSFKEAKKDKPVKERLQDIVQLQESLQPIIDRLKTLLPDDKIVQVEAKEEITEFKHIMKRFDSLEQRLQDIEDLTTIILSEI